jgi:hypothetical protein
MQSRDRLLVQLQMLNPHFHQRTIGTVYHHTTNNSTTEGWCHHTVAGAQLGHCTQFHSLQLGYYIARSASD